jgi:hypothetical protein
MFLMSCSTLTILSGVCINHSCIVLLSMKNRPRDCPWPVFSYKLNTHKLRDTIYPCGTETDTQLQAAEPLPSYTVP